MNTKRNSDNQVTSKDKKRWPPENVENQELHSGKNLPPFMKRNSMELVHPPSKLSPVEKNQKKGGTFYSKLSELKQVTIGLASPTKIKQWAEKRLPNGKIFGQVTNANTLHHKTFKPQKGGLFCERIFGPLKDFECACGKVNKPTEEQKKQFLQFRNFDRKFCPTCDVEFTWSVIRRYQLGYISLISPVTHVWYLKATPSYLSILLDFKKRHLESIIYCSETLTLENSLKSSYTFAMANSPLTLINSWKRLTNSQPMDFKENPVEIKKPSDLLAEKKSPENSKKSLSLLKKEVAKPKRLNNWRKTQTTKVDAELKTRSSFSRILASEKDWNPNLSPSLGMEPRNFFRANGQVNGHEMHPKWSSEFERIHLPLEIFDSKTKPLSLEETGGETTLLKVKEKNQNSKALDQARKNIPFYILKRSEKISTNLAFYFTVHQLATFISEFSYKISRKKIQKEMLGTLMKFQQHPFYKNYFQASETALSAQNQIEANQKKKNWLQFLSKTNPLKNENLEFHEREKKVFHSSDSINQTLLSNIPLSIYKLKKNSVYRELINGEPSLKNKKAIFASSKNPLETQFFFLMKNYALNILRDVFQNHLKDGSLLLDKKELNLSLHQQVTMKVQKLLMQVLGKLHPGIQILNRIFFKHLIKSFLLKMLESLQDSKNNAPLEKEMLKRISFRELTMFSSENTLNQTIKKISTAKLEKNLTPSKLGPSLMRLNAVTGGEANLKIKEKKEKLKNKPTMPLFLTSSHQRMNLLNLKNSNSKNSFFSEPSMKANPVREKKALPFKENKLLNQKVESFRVQKLGISLLLTNKQKVNPEIQIFENSFNSNFELKNKKLDWRVTSADSSNFKMGIFNNIYSLSHRYRWDIEKDWYSFLFYMSAPEDFHDYPISNYQHRISPLNSIPISGASIIQKLLMEFEFTELRKMDKQNRILLYDFQKVLNHYQSLAKKGYLNRFDKKDFRELLKKRDSLMRRTKLIRKLFRKNSRAEWMLLSVLPVLPPELRPIIKIQDQVAASDLNRLYQRILYRNERLKKFLKDPSTSYSYEMKYAQRLLQESVDNLIENGKSGTTPERDSRGRNLKSLSEILKGKQGRFRQHLLGKRVDYSGRSVIVVSPTLKIQECGLPKEMALELFLPFLIKRILHLQFAKTVIGAKTFMRTNKEITLEILREILQGHPILLNRAPTLHRLGIQAFQPKLIDGRAILLHPLVCSAFNADFDGDQMAVHVPITAEARAEAWKLMFARNHLLATATGEPMILPSQDMVLGCYYLTSENAKLFKYKIVKQLQTLNSKKRLLDDRKKLPENFIPTEISFPEYFSNPYQILQLYHQGKISIQLPVWLRWMNEFENEKGYHQALEIRLDSLGNRIEIFQKNFRLMNAKGFLMNQFIRTTAGRLLLYTLIESLKEND